ncbi:MAG: hypothetical protein KGV59_05860 [Tenacibaculum sp.]|nr:hypothetical protein [Tenacibaculum sp.]
MTNDYNKLNREQKKIITKFKSDTLTNNVIYEINAIQLKKLIKKYDKAIVYLFTNGCISSECKPLNYYIDYSEKNNYKLFLVMTGYSNLQETINQDLETPYFSIDCDYYQTKIRPLYTKYFKNELLSKKYSEEYLGDLFFFKKGKLITVKKTIN